MSYELRDTSYELWFTSYELRDTSDEIRVKNYELRITSYTYEYELQITSMAFLDLLTNLCESSHPRWPPSRHMNYRYLDGTSTHGTS
jgi:hypothetical protein